MYGNVQHIPIEHFDQAPPGPPVPPSLWIAAEDLDLPPLIATRKGISYQILDGTEIWQAAVLANLDRVPTLLAAGPLPLPTRHTHSAYRKDPIIEAEALEILKESHRLSDAKLADALGWSRKQVADYRRLLRLDPEVQELVRAGRLSAAKAAELVSIPPVKQCKLAQRTIQLGLSLADLRGLARQWKTSRKERQSRELPQDTVSSAPADYATDPNIARVERQLEEAVGCRVRLDTADHRLIIDYFDEAVLDGLIERLLPATH